MILSLENLLLLIPMTLGGLILIAVTYVFISLKKMTLNQLIMLTFGVVLMITPIVKNMDLGLGADGLTLNIVAASAAAEAKNSGLEKRMAALEASFELLKMSQSVPFASSSEPVPSASSSEEADTIMSAWQEAGTFNLTQPLYNYNIVVLYEESQQNAGEYIAQQLNDIGFAVGNHVASLRSVSNPQPAGTIRIIYDQDKLQVAKELETFLVSSFQNSAFPKFDILIDDIGVPVKNGDIQLQIF